MPSFLQTRSGAWPGGLLLLRLLPCIYTTSLAAKIAMDLLLWPCPSQRKWTEKYTANESDHDRWPTAWQGSLFITSSEQTHLRGGKKDKVNLARSSFRLASMPAELSEQWQTRALQHFIARKKEEWSKEAVDDPPVKIENDLGHSLKLGPHGWLPCYVSDHNCQALIIQRSPFCLD